MTSEGGHMTEQWLTYEQAATRLGVHKSTIRKAVRLGELPVTRLGYRLVRIRCHDFDVWVQKAAEGYRVGRQ
jgi:excisionase family DNA binding protein